eukprot:3593858-Amphidinium_carterae.1
MESRASILEAVKEPWDPLRELSHHEVVLTAVQHDGIALEYAAETLKGDREIVLAAMQVCPPVCCGFPQG